ncbi:MAG: outer membrane protein assembly factor BamD [Acidobacteriia bacterium]|nr:outer membrane protein assembly factor BamD [Methyloceanibacter sp.]MBX5471120.1 outer membrane protein assembly factor BamD [Acetobacteraceae bacterium]MCL6490926.1 outer membrane protein assembly factor BamD [Terriglobia bacterium]
MLCSTPSRFPCRWTWLFAIILVLLGACSSDDEKKPTTGDTSLACVRAHVCSDADANQSNDAKDDPLAALTPEQLYNRGIDALNDARYKAAENLFEKLQEHYPFSAWSANALLMEAYAQYRDGTYSDAVSSLERFIQLHPTNKNIAYAYYLRALCYFEQIEDIGRDQKSTSLALNALKEVVNRFPDSAYARDARMKIDLCRDHLAAAEMAIGRWYEKRHLYAAAINRFQRVVDEYQTTNHVPEALARLTEIYLALGMPEAAKRTAAVLAYNYPGSEWYRDTWNTLLADHQLSDNKQIGTADVKPGFFERTFGWLF